jgi:STE24 endopeptidase
VEPFTIAFLLAIALSTAVSIWLSMRHVTWVADRAGYVPPQFDGRIDLDAHQRAANYTVDRTRLGIWDTVISAGLLLAWTLGGGIAALDEVWTAVGWGEPWRGAALLMSVMTIGAILALPLDLYATFVVEARHGFNRMTAATFCTDLAKKLVLTLAIGIPVSALIIWVMESMGDAWWLGAWLLWLGINLAAVWAFPVLIAPLFNKFVLLDDELLAERINTLLTRNGFSISGIFVADGSRRSGHGNAYFTGLGASKRIVFYDTLLESLDGDEVEAVLAHEVGHFKHRHIPKQLGLSACIVLAALALLAALAEQSWFYTGLGVTKPSTAAALLLFLMVSPVFFFYLGPVLSFLSRKHEYEADAFAAHVSDGASLVRALVKLYRENASTLTPDPLYSAFHDSHPPAPLRIARLESNQSN